MVMRNYLAAACILEIFVGVGGLVAGENQESTAPLRTLLRAGLRADFAGSLLQLSDLVLRKVKRFFTKI